MQIVVKFNILLFRYFYNHLSNTPNANMADHSVGAWDELNGSKASEALMVCFENASPENSCIVVDLFHFISRCLRIAVFLNATRRDRNLTPFTSKGKCGSMQFVETKKRSQSPRELKFAHYVSG